VSDFPETLLVHDRPNPWQSVVPPIVQTSLFTFKTVEEMEARVRGETTRPVYSRGDNPTVREFERKLAQLECADDARAFSSGMGAISAAILSVVKAGDTVLCVRHVYPDTYRFMEKLLVRLGVKTRYIDGCDTDTLIAALPGAALLYLESPTSWTMETQDLPKLAAAARAQGVVTIIDNSCATPINQKPLTHGIDLVVHSASKYLSGHSDTVAGVVAGNAQRMAAINDLSYPYLGAKLSPMEGWLLLRGLRTLPMRMAWQWASTQVLLQRLQSHATVSQVMHPWCQPGPGAACLTGYSSLFTLELVAGADMRRFCNTLTLFQLGVSWGGHESLVVPALVSRAQASGPNSQIDFGITDRMVRLHVGFENTEDLWQDLQTALAAAHPTQP
jgi:cystathionine beta-lyase/cystathionine gamma-synthase